MDLNTDQVNQIISIVSGLLTILVGALVRHYLPPHDGQDDPAESTPPRINPEPTSSPTPPPTPPKETNAPDE